MPTERPESGHLPADAGSLSSARDTESTVPSRSRSVLLTAALAAVLLAFVGVTLYLSIQTARAAYAHQDSLAIDALFSEARNSIALEEVNVRHYQVEPSAAVRGRFDEAATQTRTALSRIRAGSRGQVRADAERLLAEQTAFERLGIRLLDLVADQDPEQVRLDRLDLTPTYYTLQQDVDAVARAYHRLAEH